MKDVKDFDDVRWDDGKPTVTDYVWGRDNQTASLIRAYKDEIERLREALRPNDKLLGDIAHRITQVCVGTCCHRTGGRGGPNAHPNCECREVAVEIMKIYEARAALGEKE